MVTPCKRAILFGIAALVYALCAFLLTLPLPKTVAEGTETVLVLWEDGTATEESYAAVSENMTGVEEGAIVLSREGKRGTVPAGAAFSDAVRVMETGGLADLLSLRCGEISRLEQAALFRRYGKRGYYAEEYFCWNGGRVFRTQRKDFPETVLLAGKISADVLQRAGTKKLILRAEAEFSAEALIGTAVEEIEAQAPYAAEGGAVYLDTPGGRRLIAALPSVRSLTIECDFIDSGALAPCRELETLVLPPRYEGTLSDLFGKDPAGNPRRPETLQNIIGKLL